MATPSTRSIREGTGGSREAADRRASRISSASTPTTSRRCISGDAWMSVCWTGDATQLQPRHAGDAVCARPRKAARSGATSTPFRRAARTSDAAYALIDYLLTPAINAQEVQAHGYPSTDSRTNELVPKEMLENPILYPAAELAVAAGIRRGGDADEPAARRDHGARFKSA